MSRRKKHHLPGWFPFALGAAAVTALFAGAKSGWTLSGDKPKPAPTPVKPPGVLGAPTWGPVIRSMPKLMEWAGRSAVNGSRGRPRMVRAPDGTTYLFALEGGALTARAQVA